MQGSSADAGPSRSSATTEEPPRQVFLRERLKTRCLERAVEKRERAKARGKRHLSSEPSSDGMDEMMEEDDEDEESMLNDEVGAQASGFVVVFWIFCGREKLTSPVL